MPQDALVSSISSKEIDSARFNSGLFFASLFAQFAIGITIAITLGTAAPASFLLCFG